MPSPPPPRSPITSSSLPRIAAAAMAVLVALGGAGLLVLGLLRTAAFGGDRPLVARLPRVSQPVVVTAPGMTELAGAAVRVRAASADVAGHAAPIFIGVGRADDVDAYLGGVARAEITAVEETGVLRVVARPGQASLPDPAGVDVWAACVRAGGVATLTWPRVPGRWRLLIGTDGATAPSAVELTWSGSAGASAAPALIAVGALLLVAAVAGLLAMRSGRRFGPARPPPGTSPAGVGAPAASPGVAGSAVADGPAREAAPGAAAEDDDAPPALPFRRRAGAGEGR